MLPSVNPQGAAVDCAMDHATAGDCWDHMPDGILSKMPIAMR